MKKLLYGILLGSLVGAASLHAGLPKKMEADLREAAEENGVAQEDIEQVLNVAEKMNTERSYDAVNILIGKLQGKSLELQQLCSKAAVSNAETRQPEISKNPAIDVLMKEINEGWADVTRLRNEEPAVTVLGQEAEKEADEKTVGRQMANALLAGGAMVGAGAVVQGFEESKKEIDQRSYRSALETGGVGAALAAAGGFGLKTRLGQKITGFVGRGVRSLWRGVKRAANWAVENPRSAAAAGAIAGATYFVGGPLLTEQNALRKLRNCKKVFEKYAGGKEVEGSLANIFNKISEESKGEKGSLWRPVASHFAGDDTTSNNIPGYTLEYKEHTWIVIAEPTKNVTADEKKNAKDILTQITQYNDGVSLYSKALSELKEAYAYVEQAEREFEPSNKIGKSDKVQKQLQEIKNTSGYTELKKLYTELTQE